MKFVLVEVIERDISTPEFFNTKEEAYTRMVEYMAQVLGETYDTFKEKIDSDGFVEDGCINDEMAFINDCHGNNYDWKIFEI